MGGNPAEWPASGIPRVARAPADGETEAVGRASRQGERWEGRGSLWWLLPSDYPISLQYLVTALGKTRHDDQLLSARRATQLRYM